MEQKRKISVQKVAAIAPLNGQKTTIKVSLDLQAVDPMQHPNERETLRMRESSEPVTERNKNEKDLINAFGQISIGQHVEHHLGEIGECGDDTPSKTPLSPYSTTKLNHDIFALDSFLRRQSAMEKTSSEIVYESKTKIGRGGVFKIEVSPPETPQVIANVSLDHFSKPPSSDAHKLAHHDEPQKLTDVTLVSHSSQAILNEDNGNHGERAALVSNIEGSEKQENFFEALAMALNQLQDVKTQKAILEQERIVEKKLRQKFDKLGTLKPEIETVYLPRDSELVEQEKYQTFLIDDQSPSRLRLQSFKERTLSKHKSAKASELMEVSPTLSRLSQINRQRFVSDPGTRLQQRQNVCKSAITRTQTRFTTSIQGLSETNEQIQPKYYQNQKPVRLAKPASQAYQERYTVLQNYPSHRTTISNSGARQSKINHRHQSSLLSNMSKGRAGTGVGNDNPGRHTLRSAHIQKQKQIVLGKRASEGQKVQNYQSKKELEKCATATNFTVFNSSPIHTNEDAINPSNFNSKTTCDCRGLQPSILIQRLGGQSQRIPNKIIKFEENNHDNKDLLPPRGKSETSKNQLLVTDSQVTFGSKSQHQLTERALVSAASRVSAQPQQDNLIQIPIMHRGLNLAESGVAIAAKSPFLHTYQQQKTMTPMQSMREFRKTKRLLIDQGLQSGTVNINDKIKSRNSTGAVGAVTSRHHQKLLKNPQILKMRQRASMQQYSQSQVQWKQKLQNDALQPQQTAVVISSITTEDHKTTLDSLKDRHHKTGIQRGNDESDDNSVDHQKIPFVADKPPDYGSQEKTKYLSLRNRQSKMLQIQSARNLNRRYNSDSFKIVGLERRAVSPRMSEKISGGNLDVHREISNSERFSLRQRESDRDEIDKHQANTYQTQLQIMKLKKQGSWKAKNRYSKRNAVVKKDKLSDALKQFELKGVNQCSFTEEFKKVPSIQLNGVSEEIRSQELSVLDSNNQKSRDIKATQASFSPLGLSECDPNFNHMDIKDEDSSKKNDSNQIKDSQAQQYYVQLQLSKLRAEYTEDSSPGIKQQDTLVLPSKDKYHIEHNEQALLDSNLDLEIFQGEEAQAEDYGDDLQSVESSAHLLDLPQEEDNGHIASSHFLKKWNVDKNEKVIEVEEETSILNSTNLLSKIRPTMDYSTKYSNKNLVQNPIEEVTETAAAARYSYTRNLKMKIPTNTLTVKLKKKGQQKPVKLPFQTLKRKIDKRRLTENFLSKQKMQPKIQQQNQQQQLFSPEKQPFTPDQQLQYQQQKRLELQEVKNYPATLGIQIRDRNGLIQIERKIPTNHRNKLKNNISYQPLSIQSDQTNNNADVSHNYPSTQRKIQEMPPQKPAISSASEQMEHELIVNLQMNCGEEVVCPTELQKLSPSPSLSQSKLTNQFQMNPIYKGSKDKMLQHSLQEQSQSALQLYVRGSSYSEQKSKERLLIQHQDGTENSRVSSPLKMQLNKNSVIQVSPEDVKKLQRHHSEDKNFVCFEGNKIILQPQQQEYQLQLQQTEENSAEELSVVQIGAIGGNMQHRRNSDPGKPAEVYLDEDFSVEQL